MQVVTDLASLRQQPVPGIVCGVGVFDGVHLGHQAILRGVVADARAGGTAAVFTFLNHPLTVLAPSRAPRLITPPPLKARILEEQGIALNIAVPFTPALAALSAETFVREVLVGQVGVRRIHVGDDFRFGREREGTPEDLVRLGAALGFRVTVVPEVAVGGAPVHSTLIRELLHQGKLREAQTLL
ncbi:MAG TPA: riboflavin biosynthesis protein RibF, partial [Candidatus Methylomirabilis sp.]|nr:riboflavin biosynthesis protein RibF [Candidatus Methylomirabilis sp.]